MKHSENAYFEAHADEYAAQIMATQPDFYKNAGRLLNAHLQTGDTVLDIGNGGVINYDYQRLSQLDCGDLVVSKAAVEAHQGEPHVHFITADILKLSTLPSAHYDAVIVQAVLHHLAGETLQATRLRVNTAIQECLRTLKPGGKLLVMESTVVGWFERIEQLFYCPMQVFFRLCRFGRVYQFSPFSLRELLCQVPSCRLLSSENVEIGPHIWIMGKRIPTRITPCGVTFYVLEHTSFAHPSPAERSPL